MSQKVNITDLQFSPNVPVDEKLRRLMDDLRAMANSVNSLVDEVAPLLVPSTTSVPKHVLATTSDLGPSHTVSGLVAGQVIVAASATLALFRKLNLTDLGDTDLSAPTNLDVIQFVDGFATWRPVDALVPPIDPSTIDHGLLAGLLDDDHPQYAMRNDYTQQFLLMGA